MSTKALEHAKEVVYDYIRELARNVPPDQALVAFYSLLCDRIVVGRQEVIPYLDSVIQADEFKQEQGLHFLNRSFYTICNPWHLDADMAPYLDHLVHRLNQLPDRSAQDPLTRLLRRRLHDFNQGHYGDCLRRQMCLGRANQRDRTQHRGVLGDYLADYFYLYCSTTRTPDIEELEQLVYDNPLQSGLGRKQSRKLEDTYQAINHYRRLRLQGATNLNNPTRLSVQEFERGLWEYYPKRQDGFYRRARTFENQTQHPSRYESYRPIIQEYLATSIEHLPSRNRDKLHRELFRALSTIEAQASMAVSTVINLFARLLNAVFLPEFNASSIVRLRRLLDTSGPASMTTVLLSLVLACPMIRFELEKKLGFLYRYFEGTSVKVVQWVVDFLEHINLALVMNAKQIGYFSWVSQLPTLDSI